MSTRRGAALLAAAVAVAACSGGDDGDSSGGRSTSTPATDVSSAPVDTARMAEWIDTVVGFGIRRPGYEADARTAAWIAEEFGRAGLADVTLEPVVVNRWVPETCRVSWWPEANPDAVTTVDCFALPYSQPEVDLTAPAVADDGANDLTGQIGVVRDVFQRIPQNVFAAEALEVVAPDSFIEEDSQPLPFGFRNGDIFSSFFEPTTSRGGIGMIGVLEGLGTDQYYAPYTGEDVDLPAVWLGEESGATLLGEIAAGPTTVRMEVSAERGMVPSANVVGRLPADSDSWVVIGTHLDAPWASAVEDASGIAQVVAQAYHWATVPAAERPHNLLFVAATGHMSGAAGTRAVVEAHADVLDRTVLALYLEHVARRAEPTPEGDLELTDESEPRWWFTTDRPDLRRLVGDALRAEGLDRDFILPAVGFFDAEAPLSDVAPLSLAGVPVVSLITTPIYLFDPRDTPDKVDLDGMTLVRAAAIRMVASTATLEVTRTDP